MFCGTGYMLTFLQFLNESMADKYHGIILPNGKVHDSHTGYNPGVHHEIAKKHGFSSSQDLKTKGGATFAEYDGGATAGQSGKRIEYDFRKKDDDNDGGGL